MSKLYYSETGRVLSTLGEELTQCRRARKVLELPGTAAPATLYVLARPYAGSDLPLRVSVNGTEIEPLAPRGFRTYLWHTACIPPELLRPGANTFEFWNDASAMNAWSLGIEGGHRDPASYITDDGGQHWRNEKMGFLNILGGEYVVRLRLEEGQDPPPPSFVWEDPHGARLAHLRQVLPPEVLKPEPALDRARALATWLCTSWHHTDAGQAQLYAPWDAETLLAWGRVRSGHDNRLPIIMCVHYAAAFVSCAQAIGMPARALATTDTMNSYNGHFVAEAWIAELGKWVLVDPNADTIFRKQGVPLSALEVQETGADIARWVEWGPGTDYQRRHPHIDAFVRENYLRGTWIRSFSVWGRADFLARPDLTPPGHGMTAYSETQLVWQDGLRERGFGMFPYFAGEAYLSAPPAEPR